MPPATSIREVAGNSAEVGRQARQLNGAADAWLPHGPKQKPRATGGASWVSCWRACRSLPEYSQPSTPTPSRIIGCTARRTRVKKPRRRAGLSSLRGLAEMRVNGKPTDTISQKAPPGSGAKFGRSIVMGLPGRWQTHPLNTEPNRWFLCRKSQHEKSPADAGLSRGSHQRACRAGKPTNSTARLTVGCNSPQGYRKKPRRSGAKSLILAFQTGLPT